jgi:hypothetical protein
MDVINCDLRWSLSLSLLPSLVFPPDGATNYKPQSDLPVSLVPALSGRCAAAGEYSLGQCSVPIVCVRVAG